MKFTFGIITGGNADSMIGQAIDSIKAESIGEYEIIVVGGRSLSGSNIRHVPFNEANKQFWITRKKNIITESATYDNIVYMHDYVKLMPGWFDGFMNFGSGFDVCMNRIENVDGERFRDWTLWPDDVPDEVAQMRANGRRNILLPYEMTHLSKYMYISGTYWVAKKYVMEEFKLNEDLIWGQGEDVEWSKRVREKYKFSMNPLSTVRIQKPGKDRAFDPVLEQDIQRLNEMGRD